MKRQKYNHTYQKFHRIYTEEELKKKTSGAPLLSALAISMLCASLMSAVSAHNIYQKYDTDGWSQPVITVLMQGLAHQKYPWDASPGTGSVIPSAAAGNQSNTAELPVAFVEQQEVSPLGGSSGAQADAAVPGASSSTGTSPSGQDAPSSMGTSPSGQDASPSTGTSPSGQDTPSSTGTSPSGQDASSSTGTSPSGQDASPEQPEPAQPDGSASQVTESSPPDSGNALSSEPGQYEFTQVTQEYFDDALFIGDSRAEGVKLYSGWDNLTYYAEGGMTIYNMFDSRSAQIDGQKASVEEALQSRSFGKIYLEIGINEMGTGTVDSFMEAYEDAVIHLRELQPDAILYVCGIMYVKQSKSESDPIFNNPNIQARNDRIAQLADGEHIFYLDINELVTDETGNLNPDYTWDEVHLLGKYDALWLDYFCSHGIVRDDSDHP